MEAGRSPYDYDPAIDASSEGETAPPEAQICLVFLHYDQGADEFLLNRLARAWTRGKYMHVEAYFPDQRQTWSVDYNTPVHIQCNKDYEKVGEWLPSRPNLAPACGVTAPLDLGGHRRQTRGLREFLSFLQEEEGPGL